MCRRSEPRAWRNGCCPCSRRTSRSANRRRRSAPYKRSCRHQGPIDSRRTRQLRKKLSSGRCSPHSHRRFPQRRAPAHRPRHPEPADRTASLQPCWRRAGSRPNRRLLNRRLRQLHSFHQRRSFHRRRLLPSHRRHSFHQRRSFHQRLSFHQRRSFHPRVAQNPRPQRAHSSRSPGCKSSKRTRRSLDK